LSTVAALKHSKIRKRAQIDDIDIVKIIEQLDRLLSTSTLDFTLRNACLAKRRSEHSNKRAPSYTDVASMKLKQDVESSWKCPFVSVSEEKAKHNKYSAM